MKLKDWVKNMGKGGFRSSEVIEFLSKSLKKYHLTIKK